MNNTLQSSLAPNNAAASATAPERILFDTDPGGDIDDAGAMAILHALADRGEIELLAIGVSNGHPLTVPYTRAVNAWFGRPGIPVGNVPAPGPYSRDEYMEAVIGKGPHDAEGESAPDAATLYRRILACSTHAAPGAVRCSRRRRSATSRSTRTGRSRGMMPRTETRRMPT